MAKRTSGKRFVTSVIKFSSVLRREAGIELVLILRDVMPISSLKSSHFLKTQDKAVSLAFNMASGCPPPPPSADLVLYLEAELGLYGKKARVVGR